MLVHHSKYYPPPGDEAGRSVGGPSHVRDMAVVYDPGRTRDGQPPGGSLGREKDAFRTQVSLAPPEP